ncbi:hypothetical protein Asulf_01818 [Archaeoglobus sulfaticallidus PM70-1]|uniref:4Fe-4S ferredoxin-type domain-containing protein n=1 Tax=Archaeoglobus sulfaticallidus PM70-1 TaxID=387631 RepID=N0BDT2_9EURY|nr:4Fe-4S dicluster domain-containing protein [Archaeoglobus sulfaticallidus]AGK61789.1 hypothetical protein Asulf_01818 [Archaeoglobus sulfaticallidus PM70-1]
MEQYAENLRKRIAELLEKDVDAFIVFARKKSEPREKITVIESPDEVEDVTISRLSSYNPAITLMQELNKRDKVGVVVKGCDSKAIKKLMMEDKIDRERVYIIGVTCDGVANYRKIVEAVGSDFKIEGDKIVAGDTVLNIDDFIYDNCKYCDAPTPVIYDELFGEIKTVERDFSDIEEFEKLSREERWEYWMKEMEKCIRCYACRSACPMCYCTECLVDPVNLAVSPMTKAEEKAMYPRFLGKTVNASDNLFYHLIRVIHHAGRCADCGECERACPMDIPLRKLERKLEKEIIEIFGGIPEDIPFLAKLDIIPER